jgi:hypothetical protein
MPVPSKVPVPLNFQDAAGNPLANGTVTFRLSMDISAGLASGPQVSAGIVTTLTLDANGSGTALLYPNDTMVPAGTIYFVSAYTFQGQLAWQGQITVATTDYLLQEDGSSLFLLESSPIDAILLES